MGTWYMGTRLADYHTSEIIRGLFGGRTRQEGEWYCIYIISNFPIDNFQLIQLIITNINTQVTKRAKFEVSPQVIQYYPISKVSED